MIKVNVYLTDVVKAGARPGTRITDLIGVTIHNTDNDSKGANAEAHGNLLRGSWKDKQQSWHYAVDDKEAYQSIPENEVAWHAGDGRGNGNYKTIAVEICMNKDGDIEKATDNAAQLTADVLHRHGLPATAVFQHNHWSGKNCPSQIRKGIPYDWETFMSKVSKYYSDGKQPVDKPKPVVKPKYIKNGLVREFQIAINRDYGWRLDLDGSCGHDMQAHLKLMHICPYPDTDYNDRPKTIKLVQRELGGLILDGCNGPKTSKKISDFQKKYGLVANGIVGIQTIMKICEIYA